MWGAGGGGGGGQTSYMCGEADLLRVKGWGEDPGRGGEGEGWGEDPLY